MKTELGILAGTLGVVLGFGYFVQVHKIVVRRSAKDISYITFSLIVLTTVVWTVYGIVDNNMLIIVANVVVGAIGSGLVLALSIYYNRRAG